MRYILCWNNWKNSWWKNLLSIFDFQHHEKLCAHRWTVKSFETLENASFVFCTKLILPLSLIHSFSQCVMTCRLCMLPLCCLVISFIVETSRRAFWIFELCDPACMVVTREFSLLPLSPCHLSFFKKLSTTMKFVSGGNSSWPLWIY